MGVDRHHGWLSAIGLVARVMQALEERFHEVRTFFARIGFDAAAHVHRTRADGFYRLDNVCRSESARQHHTCLPGDWDRERPVKSFARPSIFARNVRVENEHVDVVRFQVLKGKRRPNVKRFEHPESAHAVTVLRGLQTAELRYFDTRRRYYVEHPVSRLIGKNPYRNNTPG